MKSLSPTPTPAPSSTPSDGIDSNKHPAADGPRFNNLQHGYCRVKRCRYCHDPADLTAPAAGSTGDKLHGSALSCISKPAAGVTGTNRNGSTSRMSNVGTDSSQRAIIAWCGSGGGGGGHDSARGSGGSSGRGGTGSTSSSGLGCGTRHMARPTLEASLEAISEGRRVGDRLLTVDVLGSHGESVRRPVYLQGSIPAPGSGTRHDARVRSGVNEKCGPLLPM